MQEHTASLRGLHVDRMPSCGVSCEPGCFSNLPSPIASGRWVLCSCKDSTVHSSSVVPKTILSWVFLLTLILFSQSDPLADEAWDISLDPMFSQKTVFLILTTNLQLVPKGWGEQKHQTETFFKGKEMLCSLRPHHSHSTEKALC